MKQLERIGAIGDVHAEDGRLWQAIQFLKGQGVDLLLATGDIVDGEGDVASCVELLEQHRVVAVRGERDRRFLERRPPSRVDPRASHVLQFLAGLPRVATFDTSQGQLMLCHGLGGDDQVGLTSDASAEALEAHPEVRRILRTTCRVLIGGHTHRRVVRHLRHLTMINAGSLLPETGPCLTLIDLLAKEVIFFDLMGNDRWVEALREPLAKA